MNSSDWNKIWSKLGIGKELVEACTLPLQDNAVDLVSAGTDATGREQFVTPMTLQCWQEMEAAAGSDGIGLLIVSAYRSVEYQCQLIQNKLDKGQQIDDIVKVNAIPGFSEHHSGCAIDITTDECEPLTEAFDQTSAFRWLEQNAAGFRFAMTYPRDNSYNIIYEPWHWACLEHSPL